MMTTALYGEVRNYMGGAWRKASSEPASDVLNPATGELIARSPAGSAREVADAVEAAAAAFPNWRATPPAERIQYLFRLKQLLEDHFEEVARITT
ncbi:MAG: aldehyde dehydrogenase family protein, partial [Gemmataceae bacterium]